MFQNLGTDYESELININILGFINAHNNMFINFTYKKYHRLNCFNI